LVAGLLMLPTPNSRRYRSVIRWSTSESKWSRQLI
jgi:hypothetical protein